MTTIIAKHNMIIYPLICEVEYDNHIFEVFGSTPRHESPEVTQIAFKGIPADITHILSQDVIESIQASAERQYLDDRISAAREAMPMIFGDQAHTLRNI